ncbi:hypothetical protein ACFQAT_11130 [Undibacterium arcticum]|uniref:hypothetical protein n=1 Tax=Undibacterium arcticum TaxID=1762892 RepID=UPI00360B1846
MIIVTIANTMNFFHDKLVTQVAVTSKPCFSWAMMIERVGCILASVLANKVELIMWNTRLRGILA